MILTLKQNKRTLKIIVYLEGMLFIYFNLKM